MRVRYKKDVMQQREELRVDIFGQIMEAEAILLWIKNLIFFEITKSE